MFKRADANSSTRKREFWILDKMLLDTEDLKILREFSRIKKGRDRKLSEIVESIYKNHGDREYHAVKRRIISMSKYGLFDIVKNSPTTFTLNQNNVFLKKFNFPTRESECIAVLIENKWNIFEI